MSTLGELKAGGYNYLKKITAVDHGDGLTVLYVLYDTLEQREEMVAVELPPKDPAIETVMSVYKSADWHERELSEMFGIEIKGRNAPKLILEWRVASAPLRKSFAWGFQPRDEWWK